jgi:GntR family transcriptional regulator
MTTDASSPPINPPPESASAATDLFRVSPGSPEPIYKQLIEQVRRMAASGQLSAGTLLPSVRELAQHLAVNPMTVSKAYSLLEATGQLERKRGVGMAIATASAAHNDASRLEQLRPTLQRAALEAAQLNVSAADAAALFESLLESQLNPPDRTP